MKYQNFLLTSLKLSKLYYPSFSLFSLNVQRCFGGSGNKNPYDVLGLKSDCSMQDIKKAYIKLCKKLHPDMKPGDASQHKKFVELNNAYTTLVNAESRRQFDHKSAYRSSSDNFGWKHRQSYYSPNQEASENDKPWYEREEYRKYYHQQPNVNTTHHLNNTWTLVGCFFLVIIGSILTFSAYRYATQYTLNIVDKRSKKISENYEDVRRNALGGNKEAQIKEIKKRWNL